MTDMQKWSFSTYTQSNEPNNMETKLFAEFLSIVVYKTGQKGLEVKSIYWYNSHITLSLSIYYWYVLFLRDVIYI